MRLHSRSRGPWLPGNPTFCPPSPQKAISWSPPEAQRVKDPVLAWLWLRLQLWRRSVLPSPSSASALALLCPAMYTRVQMPWVTVPLGPPRSLPSPQVPAPCQLISNSVRASCYSSRLRNALLTSPSVQLLPTCSFPFPENVLRSPV